LGLHPEGQNHRENQYQQHPSFHGSNVHNASVGKISKTLTLKKSGTCPEKTRFKGSRGVISAMLRSALANILYESPSIRNIRIRFLTVFVMKCPHLI
jgi:hypothetical protein